MACFRPPNARPAATPGSPPCAPYSSSSPENSTSPGSTRRPHSPLEIQKSLIYSHSGLGRSGTAHYLFAMDHPQGDEREIASPSPSQYTTRIERTLYFLVVFYSTMLMYSYPAIVTVFFSLWFIRLCFVLTRHFGKRGLRSPAAACREPED
jgi:hypothetical protein